jgi:hypothetical protein
MFFTTDSSVLSTHAHNETNVAYRCAKTLVFTSSDMKSTDKRIVCQGEYQRILANFGRIFVFPDSPTTIVSKDKVTIIYQEQQYIDLLKSIDCGEVRPDRTGRKDRIRTLDGIRSEKFYTHLDNQARFRSRSHRRTPVVCFRKFGRHGSWTQERQDLGT